MLGGAILDESTPLTLNYSYVQTSQTVGSPSYPDAEGGGIYASQSPVLINGGYVDFNQATSQAGGWTLGGGIDVVGGPLTLINSSAEANLVAGGIQAAGGGINATGADVSLASNVVANNSVTAGNAPPDNFGPSAQGGGIYFNSSYAAHTLTISSSYVYSNQLTGGRGGDGSAATFVIPSGSYAPQFIADQGVPLGVVRTVWRGQCRGWWYLRGRGRRRSQRSTSVTAPSAATWPTRATAATAGWRRDLPGPAGHPLWAASTFQRLGW